MVAGVARNDAKTLPAQICLQALVDECTRFSKAVGLCIVLESIEVSGFTGKFGREVQAAGKTVQRVSATINADTVGPVTESSLTAGTVGNILKDNGPETRIAVTKESIENVRPFACDALLPALPKLLTTRHKQLLMKARKCLPETEAARCYDMEMRSLDVGYSVGSQNASRVRATHYEVPHIAMHNHPDGVTFSPADMQVFLTNDNVRIATAVGNNGIVCAIEKNASFNATGMSNSLKTMWQRFNTAETLTDAIQVMKQYLEESAFYGAKYYSIRNR